MTTQRNALGRGIGALIPGARTPGAAPASAATSAAEALARGDEPGSQPLPEIPVDAIDPNPVQPRQHFESEALVQLGESIRRHGLLQPVVVRRVGDRYELVVGERRWRAAQQAGLRRIPAVVADVAPRDRLAVALVENVQRRDLNAIELAHAFRALCEAGATQDEVGTRVSLDRSTIANHLRLLELPPEYQADVEAGRLSVGHAKALLQVESTERRRQLRERIVAEGLSVRAAEDVARGTPGARRSVRPRRARPGTDPDLQRVLDALRQRYQTRVKITGDASRGRVEIEYFGQDDLTRITELLLGNA